MRQKLKKGERHFFDVFRIFFIYYLDFFWQFFCFADLAILARTSHNVTMVIFFSHRFFFPLLSSQRSPTPGPTTPTSGWRPP